MTDGPPSTVDAAPAVPEADPPPGIRRRSHTVRLVAAALFGVALLVAFALASGLDDDGQIAGSPLIGHAAPIFELSEIDGGRLIVSNQMRGDVVVVNFWATWCVPCRREAPVLEAFARRWDGNGVRVVGILYGDTPGAARSFRDEFDLTYPLVDDPTAATAVAYGVTGVPETFVIDTNGVVVARVIGALGPTTLDDVLADVQDGRTVEAENGPQQQAPSATTP